MKIAILGWGSLIWNPENLSVQGNWTQAQLELPLEFSRISKDGRLTLVIDPDNGENNKVFYINSGFNNLNDAINNLKEREHTTEQNIGYVNLLAHTSRTHFTAFSENIKQWAERNDYAGVIWTDLICNFNNEYKSPFSVGNAMKYLTRLSGNQKANALKYVSNTNQEINTPLRRKINCSGWLEEELC